MKILLVAYACEPNKGSEPAVGWNMMESIANKLPESQVYLLTRTNNRESIASKTLPGNVYVVYFDLPSFVLKLKKIFGLTRLYYYFWVIFSSLRIKRLHSSFDLIHHLTFVSDCLPSPGALIPCDKFIWGPIGGNDYISKKNYLETKPYLLNCLSSIVRWFLRNYDPLTILTKKKADVVGVINWKSKNKLGLKPNCEFFVSPAIAIQSDARPFPSAGTFDNSKKFTVLCVGKHISIKNFTLSVDVFFEFINRLSSSEAEKCELVFVGSGPEAKRLESKVQKMGLSACVSFVEHVDHKMIGDYYRQASVFMFPSFENAGFVYLEAMLAGLPVLAFNRGGGSTFVTSMPELQLVPFDLGYKKSVFQFSDKLMAFYRDPKLRSSVGKGNQKHTVENHCWDSRVRKVMSYY